VGVFVNQHEDLICSIVDKAWIIGVQMHGDKEDPHVADLIVERRPRFKILAAISMYHPNPQGWAMMWNPDSILAFLVDSGTSSKHGGTGKAFDWGASVSVVSEIKSLAPVVVAGGLTADNVGEAMEVLHHPWGVDVSSGVEARPGKKDPEKVRAFVRAVRETDKKAG